MFKKNQIVKLDKTLCSIYDTSRLVKIRSKKDEKPESWIEHNFPEDNIFEKIEFSPLHYFNPYEMKMAREILNEIKELVRQEKYRLFSYTDFKTEVFEIKARNFVKKYYPNLQHSLTESKVKTFNKTMDKLSKFQLTIFKRFEDDVEYTSLFQKVLKKRKTNSWTFRVSVLMQIMRFENNRHDELDILNYEKKHFSFHGADKLSQLSLQVVLYLTSKYEESHGRIKYINIDFRENEFFIDFKKDFLELKIQSQKNLKSSIKKSLNEINDLNKNNNFIEKTNNYFYKINY